MIKIEIKKLFGRFDYSIALNSNGLTILTGPNGYGKSTILRIIQCLAQEFVGFAKLMKIDFHFIKIEFDGQIFEIENRNKEFRLNGLELPKTEIEEMALMSIEASRHYIQIDASHYLDRRTERVFDVSEYLNKYDEISNDNFRSPFFESRLKRKYGNSFNILSQLKECIGNVYFVQEQRLIKTNYSNKYREEKSFVNVIEELPIKMKKLLTDYSTRYSKTAANLDSTYPSRLFKNAKQITEEEYKLERENFEVKVKKLSKYKLSTVSMIDATFKEEYSKALKIYFDDFNKKYAEYEPLIEKLDLFTEIINSRLSYKKIEISNEKGLVVLDDDNNKVLDISQLSSGEKQEIVLFYDLIFETPENTLLLIDEPEISLHIVWQKMFIDDLLKIVGMKNLNVIVATHAPQIINGHWDNTIELGVMYEQHKDALD